MKKHFILKVIIFISLVIPSFGEENYIDFGTNMGIGSTLGNKYLSGFMSRNKELYGIDYSFSASSRTDDYKNTSGITVTKYDNRGNNFRFSQSVYLGWKDSFGGANLRELDYNLAAYYQFPISDLLLPYFGGVTGFGLRSSYNMSDSTDWLVAFLENFIVAKVEVGNNFIFNDTISAKLYYQKSFTYQKADTLGFGLIFSVPK